MIIIPFKTGFRMIAKQKIYTIINLTGLAVGLSTCLLIMLYIIDEYRYDTFHRDADRIYRVNLFGRLSDQEFHTCFTAAPVAAGMNNEYPEIDDACRIAIWKDVSVKYEDISFTESKILVADSNFFDFFSFALLNGDKKEVLKSPNGIVLTESMAERVFGYKGKGDVSPIGKALVIGNDKRVFKVVGITENPPHYSHFHYSLILPMESWEASHSQVWINSNLNTYVKLNKNSSWKEVQDKFQSLVAKYVGPQVQAAMGISMDEFYKQGGAYGYTLQPVLKIHLFSNLDQELEPVGNIQTIYILITIVVFVLIIACINFMNLSTARFSSRAREVGVRKTMGASKGLLVFQFLSESFLLTFLSFLFALIIIALFLSRFNMLSGKELDFGMILRYDVLMIVILILALVGILSGSYPAFYLSSFKPVEVLKGKIKAGKGSGSIRRALVVFQFSISIVLIISTIIVFKQLRHLDKLDMGFKKENILVIKNADVLAVNKISFKNEVNAITGITGASIVTVAPPDMNHSDVFMPIKDDAKDVGFNYCFADEDLLNTLGLSMVSGRFFSTDFPSDSGGVIINEAAAKLIGWDDATGEKIKTHWQNDEKRTVIGVVKDFNFQTLKKKITPLAIFPGSEGALLLLKLAPNNTFNTIQQVESKWKAFTDNAPFDYTFMDKEFSSKFRKEQQLAGIILLFTILAIFIACLGLFGLATFMAEQRRKEMGIRKVLGASLTLILRTLSLEFFGLVLVAYAIAIPVTWFIITRWLNDFAYRIGIDIIPFILGGIVALLVTFLSVIYQTLKVASRNPVEALQYE